MADAWDEYIKRQQSAPAQTVSTAPSNPLSILFGALGGLIPGMGSSSQGAIRPDLRGMYTPSVGEMPVGPPTPINYGAMKSLLNSGVLRAPGVPMPTPAPQPAPTPTPAPQPAPQMDADQIRSQFTQLLEGLGFNRRGFTSEGN